MFDRDGDDEGVEVTGCPMAMLTPDVLAAFEMIGWARAGTFPVSGGVLDQAQAFLDAMRLVRSEESRIEAAKYNRSRRNE